jgi:hypothetical protein
MIINFSMARPPDKSLEALLFLSTLRIPASGALAVPLVLPLYQNVDSPTESGKMQHAD